MPDLSKHSVSLEEVVFDTFDGRFLRLDMVSMRVIRRLRDAIRPIYNPGYGAETDLLGLGERDLVIGYVSTGGAYAYPLDILSY